MPCAQRHCLHCVFIRCVGGISHCTIIVGLLLHEDQGEYSEVWGGGVGGRKLFSHYKIYFSKNVPGVRIPGVRKRKKKHFFLGGKKFWRFFPLQNTEIAFGLFLVGGDFGVFGGAPRPPGGRAGSENDTLLSLTVTGKNFRIIRLAVQKLSSGNRGDGRKHSDKTIMHSPHNAFPVGNA